MNRAELERLLDSVEPSLRRTFVQALATIRSERTLQDITLLIQQGRAEDALAVAEAAMLRLSNVWADAYVRAANATAADLTFNLRTIINFDRLNFRAVAAMRDNQLRLVREFVEEQRQVVRGALLEGVERALNPRDSARLIRDSIGLTTRQQAAVANYRRLLESLSSESLERALRDRRFDSTVRRAISEDRPLSTSQVDQMVSRYRDRYLIYRSEVIARTEALRAVHQGSEALYQQAFETGALSPDALVRRWNTANDERVRPAHETMHGQLRAVGEPFEDGDGNLIDYPGDPDAPAETVIQCRCVVSTRFK